MAQPPVDEQAPAVLPWHHNPTRLGGAAVSWASRTAHWSRGLGKLRVRTAPPVSDTTRPGRARYQGEVIELGGRSPSYAEPGCLPTESGSHVLAQRRPSRSVVPVLARGTRCHPRPRSTSDPRCVTPSAEVPRRGAGGPQAERLEVCSSANFSPRCRRGARQNRATEPGVHAATSAIANHGHADRYHADVRVSPRQTACTRRLEARGAQGSARLRDPHGQHTLRGSRVRGHGFRQRDRVFFEPGSSSGNGATAARTRTSPSTRPRPSPHPRQVTEVPAGLGILTASPPLDTVGARRSVPHIAGFGVRPATRGRDQKFTSFARPEDRRRESRGAVRQVLAHGR